MINQNISRSKGFTLVELMVVIAIIGIIAVIAFPSYQEFIRTGYRADAMATMIELTTEMEQYKFERQTYKGAATGGGDTGVPDENLLMALDEGVTNHYVVTISSASRDGYLLKAQPKGSQEDDACGVITIGKTGVFNYAPLDGSDPPDYCEK
ncbi:type IV pilin protein [Litoribrevibacter albus]|uniref:Type IV minor pilin protein PilE n=1 Tax=Litoribrevibacter albus TaxID=1473156 RepID=A0AA37SFE3_9GAMM|nr:type IV pilin protein [Litoribrevibacter albus]GLQ33678.1 type IV minor pilin protein PilE [Litoribrevibacter albus]